MNIARPQLDKWARIWNYSTDLRFDSLCETRPPAWSKVVLIRELLESHKYVIWVDADTVVVDPWHDMTKTVSWRKPLAMVAHTYHDQWFPNMGVMAIQSTRFTRRLFREIWEMDQYSDHKWWENAALLVLLGFDISHEPLRQTGRDLYGHRINWLSTSWNSMGLDPSPKPIIKHYPGVGNEERLKFMTQDVQECH